VSSSRADGDARSYYAGNRWLVDDKVASVYAVGNRVFVASEKGLAVLELRQMTLAEKVSIIQDLAYPRHDRFGLVRRRARTHAARSVSSWTDARARLTGAGR
jgi:hypothetical protein